MNFVLEFAVFTGFTMNPCPGLMQTFLLCFLAGTEAGDATVPTATGERPRPNKLSARVHRRASPLDPRRGPDD